MSPRTSLEPKTDGTPSPKTLRLDAAEPGRPRRSRRARRRASAKAGGGGLSPAQQRLAERYIALARNLAKPYKELWPDQADEFEGVSLLALVEAAEMYQPSRKFKFVTFARHRIRGALNDVRRQYRDRFAPAEGEGEVRVQPAGTVAMNEGIGRIVGIEPEPPVGWELEGNEAVERRLRTLPPRHREICREIYLEGRSQTEAARVLGLSQSRLSDVHKAALVMLQHACPGHDGALA